MNCIIKNKDCIHIDVENLESEVLKGSYNLIKLYNPIIIFEGHIQSNLEKVNECFDFFLNMDYIDEDAGNPGDARNFVSIPKQIFDYFNYVILY